MKKLLCVLVLAVSLCFVGVGSTEAQSATQYGKDAYNVPQYKCWTITLNKEVDYGTLSANNIYVVDSKNNRVPVQTALTQGKKILYLFNIEPYKAGETYTIYIQNLKSTTGATVKPIYFRFHIAN
ncbi:Ig-like domain-containing protein [Clostridium luticellarii]|uniref:SbsA Ig-like domain-containing protein n=1 Tax=Clostridium luticellarii TaxID=1691940 RepID=A0A2T0BLJ1_9CLOT|nr:Ig-like domain-containing protein [Clostridium luticellarii]PRR84729.1 hypothetical protein CLLU_22680 [Clostridium luticellarii]